MAIKTIKIHPAIGIARLGNSPEFFVGPELPGDRTPPPGGYKDAQCRLKRQAARFRLFGYDQNGILVQEITAADAQITWTAHVANTKAEGDQFHPVGTPSPGPRNASVANRSTLKIDPGPRSITGPNQAASFDTGTFLGANVPLGEMRTDQDGRLLIFGGFGSSASPTNAPLTYWAQNDGWHDDVSDGPIGASVTLNGTNTPIQAVSAWVICPPPKFAPAIDNIITLYDTLYQVAVGKGWITPPATPSFNKDIFPVLDRAVKMKWVNARAAGAHSSFVTISPMVGMDAARQAIVGQHRDPSLPPTQSSPSDMPKIWSDLYTFAGTVNAPLTRTQYSNMQKWAAGNFTNDWSGGPPPPDTQITPEGLDRAALENCVGGAFYPGIETSWMTRDVFPFVEPFRPDVSQLNPGDLTRQMAVPWQTDFTDCAEEAPLLWWPAQRPDQVWPEDGTPQVDWTRDLISNWQDMIQNWSRLGIVVQKGNQYLETERSVVCKRCFLIVNKSTFGQDEVAVNGTFGNAYWVGVEGYTAAQLGLTPGNLGSPPLIPMVTATINPALNPSLTPVQVTDINNMLSVGQFGPPPVVAEDPTLQQTFQRFLYPFTISFTGDQGFKDLLPNQVAIVTLNASITAGNVTRTAAANIELTKGEDPYFEDVNPQNVATQPSWLSFDLRFFKMTVPQNQTKSRFGATMTSKASDAPGFIASVIGNLTQNNGNVNGDTYETGLSQNEDASALEFHQQDDNGNLVFNFAVARVRLIGKTPGAQAPKVRVFFRLFQAQNTVSDFNPNTTYRFAGDNQTYGRKVPLLGVQNDPNGNPEYVTIPCFASARNNLTGPADMSQQLEDTPNAYTINVVPNTEVDSYFGCWLDLNQPQQKFLPLAPPAGNLDGPWTTQWQNNSVQSIRDAILAAPHQCLIAEIRFDDTPIPPGATSSTSDKLAQRNIAWLHGPNPGAVSSRRVPHPFEIRPSPATVRTPDELMIMWGTAPQGSTASLYLPEVSAADVLSLAGSMYGAHLLTSEDAHTIKCPVGGVTFIPIPKGTARNAGLMTVDLPARIRRGQVFEIVVRQITEASANFAPPPPPPQLQVRAAAVVRTPDGYTWRRLLGAFQFTITISTKQHLLFPEERLLAVLRWMVLIMPPQKRWYPVLLRYIQQIAGRVLGFGGNPTQILPSPTGQVPGHGPEPEPGEEERERKEKFTGKIAGLIFDRFGDFEGFQLDTEDGERKFFSREKEIEELARRAWRERLRITVWAECDEPHRPLSIIVREPPAPFQP